MNSLGVVLASELPYERRSRANTTSCQVFSRVGPTESPVGYEAVRPTIQPSEQDSPTRRAVFRLAPRQWGGQSDLARPVSPKHHQERACRRDILTLRLHYAAQERAFRQIEEDAQARHPDPTPDDIAAALAVEAALPYRKRTEAQLRRNFEPLAAHLPQDIRSKRKRFVQRGQRAWNRANPSPLTDERQRALTAEFVKTYARAARS